MRCLQLSFGLVDIGCRSDTAVVAVARDIDRPGVGIDGVFEQNEGRIRAAQREIAGGELCLEGKPDGRQITGAGVGTLAGSIGRVTQTSEEIYFPRQGGVGGEIVPENPITVRVGRIGRGLLPLKRRVGIDGRKYIRPRAAGDRARLLVPRDRGVQVRVRITQLLLQSVQLRIAEGLPPCILRCGIRGCSREPLTPLAKSIHLWLG